MNGTALRALGASAIASVLAFCQNPSPTIVIDQTGAVSGQAIEFGGAGRWLAVWTSEGDIRIVNATDGSLMTNLPVPVGEGISMLSTDPVRDRLARVSRNSSVSVINIASGKPLWRSPTPVVAKGYSAQVTGLHFTSDGARLQALISVAPPNRLPHFPKFEVTLRVWDAANGAVLEERKIPDPVQSFSNDGRWMFGSHFRSNLQCSSVVIDAGTLKRLGPEIDGRVVAAHAGSGRALVMSLQGRNAGLRLVNVATGSEVAALEGLSSGIFSPDGGTVVAPILGYGWQFIDAGTGKVRFAGSRSLPMTMASANFSPDGAHFVTLAITPIRCPILVSATAPSEFRMLAGSQAPALRSDGANGLIRSAAGVELRGNVSNIPFATCRGGGGVFHR